MKKIISKKLLFFIIIIIFININVFGQANLKLDSSFANNGIMIYNNQNYPNSHPISNYNFMYSSVVQENGDFSVCGFHDNNYLIGSFEKNGTLDTTFGNMGTIAGNFSNFNNNFRNEIYKTIKLNSGKYLAFCSVNDLYNMRKSVVVRFNQSGQIDSTFADNGILNTQIFHFPYNSEIQHSTVFIDPNESIIVIGKDTLISKYHFIKIQKFLPNGNVDISFGNNGVIYFNDSINFHSSFKSENGDIYIAGVNNQNKIKIIKLNEYGIPYTNFILPACHISGFDNSLGYLINSFKIQDDGKFILAGNFGAYEYYNLAQKSYVFRLNQDGSIDSTFNNIGSRYFKDSVNDIVINSVLPYNNKIYLGGYIEMPGVNNQDLNFLLIRLNYDGTYDSLFGNNGIINLDFGNKDYILDLKIQKNKLLTIGNTGHCGQWNIFATRHIIESNLSSPNIYSPNSLLNLFPNPASDNLTILLSENQNPMELKIYNIIGKNIYSCNIERNSIVKTIDCSSFKVGIYKVILFEKGILKSQTSLVITK